MKKMLNDAKWTLCLSGILMVIIGSLIFVHPVAAAWAYAQLIGWLLIAVGIFYGVGFFFNSQKFYAGWMIIAALVNILVGAMLTHHTGLSYDVLITVFGLWTIVNGATDFANAFTLRALRVRDWLWLLIGGLVEVVAGLLIVFFTDSGFIAITTVIAISFIWRGVVDLLNAWRIQKGLNKVNRLQKEFTKLLTGGE